MLVEPTRFEPPQPLTRELLRESHHRITNHLSLLVSIDPHAECGNQNGPDTLTREDASGLLNEISANLVAMAHLHRQLVREPGSATVDLSDLLVESCSEMATSLCLSDRVCFRHKFTAPCEITADETSSLSLQLREVVMNAIKYAHPDALRVNIDVSCRVTPEGYPEIDISDDGVGLPAGFDERCHGGAGLRIIRALAQKLQAKLTLESSGAGVSFRVLLPARVSRSAVVAPSRAAG